MTKTVKNIDFSGAALRNRKADGWVFVRCNFDRADLSHSSFQKSRFIFCSFDRASWEHSNLEGAKFYQDEAWCTEVDDGYSAELKDEDDFDEWSKANILLEPSDRPECNGRLSSFHRSNLHSAEFCGYNLNDSDFSEADLTNASFDNTKLNHCSFKNIRFVNGGGHSSDNDKTLFGEETSLEFADFSETNLRGIHFKKCASLEAANFMRSDLAGAVFEGQSGSLMSLYRACFDHARLSESVFDNCDITSASFISSDLGKVKFLGETQAIAVNFLNAFLAGCQAIDINFTAANFSGSFIGSELNEGIVPASFNLAILTSADFSGSALIGVNFDGADLSFANFDSATFTIKQNKNGIEHDEKQKVEPSKRAAAMSFNGTNLEKAVFRTVNLNGYVFVDCPTDGAIFDNSELENVKFIHSSLSGCSFEGCYLRKARFFLEETPTGKGHFFCNENLLSLEGASFTGSNLEEVRFDHARLVGATFSGSNISSARFCRCDLTSSDFKNTKLTKAEFDRCILDTANFEQVNLQKAKFDLVQINAAQFVRAQGDEIEFSTDKNNKIPNAVVFRHHELSGTFQFSVRGAIVEHGTFCFDEKSIVSWLPGLHGTGALFKVGGDFSLDCGLLENSKVEIKKCKKANISNSYIQNSEIIGLDYNCCIENSAINSSSLGKGWELSKFVNVKLNLVDLVWDKLDKHKEIINIENADIERFDIKTIKSLKINAESLGEYKQYDNFFNLEMIQERSDSNEQLWPLIMGYIFSFLFVLFPISNSFGLITLTCQYILALFLLVLACYLFYLSRIRFLDHLYGYGHKPIRILITTLIVIFGFSFSRIGFSLREILASLVPFSFDKKSIILNELANSFHYSFNTFVNIGYWDHCDGYYVKLIPDNIMRLYSNIESTIGIIIMSLLVVTIIRRTSGR